jgi:hypothetical protein
MSGPPPYLSVVAASRNDDHGTGLSARTQVFVDALADHAARRALRCELVLVEWNPPPGRPPLAETLRWPDDRGFLGVRIVRVPEALHRRFGERLEFHQMPAKNVGIRRARGAFVLSTNVDVLWSDALADLLARRELEPGRVVRADRVDVAAGVPLSLAPEQRLAWCARHVLRASRADDLWFAPADGLPHGLERATIPSAQRFAADASAPGAPLRLRIERRLRRSALGRALETPPRSGSSSLAWRGARGLVYAARHAALVAGGWRSGGRLRDLDQTLDEALRPFRRFPALHVLNCGDFLLMARGDWDAIGGHPELPCFSLHLDSLTLHHAVSRGIHEQRLAPDQAVFHQEHGSAASAGGHTDAFYGALRGRGVSVMGWGRFASYAQRLARGQRLRLGPDDWGLAGEPLPETRIERGLRVAAGTPACADACAPASG